MGPSKSRRRTKRRAHNWSTELGFLFFTILFLTLALQRNNVNADTDDSHYELTVWSTNATIYNMTGEFRNCSSTY